MIGDSGQADEVERVNLVIRSDLKGGDGTEGSLAARLHVTPPSPPITPPWLHVTPGLHKLWYPVVRDMSTWSKFGAHGEHGDVFLFSNLGAL